MYITLWQKGSQKSREENHNIPQNVLVFQGLTKTLKY